MQVRTNWNDLQYFLSIRETGSLVGAARKLGVDQTTVGRRLGALEDSLQARLFTRTPDGLVLTAAGERIVRLADELERTMLEIEHQVAGDDARIRGSVRIATSDAFALGYLAHALGGLSRRHPELHVELVTGASSLNLLRREADIALRLGPRPQQLDLVARRLADVGWSLYASSAYRRAHGPIRLEDQLLGHSVIDYCDELAEISAARWLRSAAAAARVVMSCNNVPVASAAAVAGLGLTVLPCFIGAPHRALERVLPETVASGECWLLVHPELARAGRVRAVVDYLVEQVERSRDQLAGTKA